MFQVGDTVVYLSHGVGTVRRVEDRTVGDREQKFLVIEFPLKGMTAAVPADAPDGVGVRPVMSASDAEEVMEVLRSPATRIGSTWSQRVAKCQARIKTGDPREAAACIRDLSPLDRSGRISYNEASVLGKTRSNIAEELAVVWGTPTPVVESRIDEALDGATAAAA